MYDAESNGRLFRANYICMYGDNYDEIDGDDLVLDAYELYMNLNHLAGPDARYVGFGIISDLLMGEW